MLKRMIRIFNKKENREIEIDNSFPQVTFTPNDWNLDNPHIIIKLQNIDFIKHTNSCDECKAFFNALGTDTCDWQINYLGKSRRLDLLKFAGGSQDNHLSYECYPYFQGTSFRLNLDKDTKESLALDLTREEQLENYEGCKKIFEKLNRIDQETDLGE